MNEHPREATLHDWVEGLLEPRESEAVRAHLEACEACRAQAEAVRRIRGELAGLPGEAAPPPEVWAAVEARLSHRDTGGTTADSRGARRFSLAQVAAAVVLVSVLSGGLVWSAVRGGPLGDPASAGGNGSGSVAGPAYVRPAALTEVDSEYARAVADLEMVFEEGKDVLAPETLQVLERSLATIDQALEEVRVALEADPASQVLGRMLVHHQMNRMRLLQQAAAAVQAVS